MSDILLSIGLGSLFGAPSQDARNFMSSANYALLQREWEEDQRLLAEWGVIHRRTFFWFPSRGGLPRSVTSGKHPTAEAADKDAAARAIEAGYIAPKWWEWWRWRENRLPGDKPKPG